MNPIRTMKAHPAATLAAALALALAACTKQAAPAAAASSPAPSVCDNADGALDDASFIFLTAPRPGERVASGFTGTGCSRTFESNVTWRLLGRDGAVLASGFTNGGGVDGPGPFSFPVTYSVAERQIGHLEVTEEDASDGEGFPPARNIIPLVLAP